MTKKILQFWREKGNLINDTNVIGYLFGGNKVIPFKSYRRGVEAKDSKELMEHL